MLDARGAPNERPSTNSKALHNNQLVQDLSQGTGLDEQTAARSIGAGVDMLDGQQGLESLLGQSI